MKIIIESATYYESRYSDKAIHSEGELIIKGKTYDFDYTSDDDGLQLTNVDYKEERKLFDSLTDKQYNKLEEDIKKLSKKHIKKLSKIRTIN